MTVFPRPLPRHATIGIVAPASPQRDPKRLMRGIAYLEGLGHTVVLGRSVNAHYGGYLAGTDEERAADLHAMFADKRIDAILCSRGGYGSARLLPLMNWQVIRRNPKIFVGFSDITALQLAMYKATGLVTFSGALPSVDMADGMLPETEEWFWRILTSTKPLGSIVQPAPLRTIQKGTADGRILGGNLSVLVTLLGTAHLPSLKGAILAIEDVGEESYRIDRMLNHLRLSGVLGQVAGMVTGSWTQRSRPAGSTPHRDVNDVLRDYAAEVSGPVAADLMYGHEPAKLTLPIGALARLSSRGKGLRFLEPAVQA